jgi:hypothetical protein
MVRVVVAHLAGGLFPTRTTRPANCGACANYDRNGRPPGRGNNHPTNDGLPPATGSGSNNGRSSCRNTNRRYFSAGRAHSLAHAPTNG